MHQTPTSRSACVKFQNGRGAADKQHPLTCREAGNCCEPPFSCWANGVNLHRRFCRQVLHVLQVRPGGRLTRNIFAVDSTLTSFGWFAAARALHCKRKGMLYWQVSATSSGSSSSPAVSSDSPC